MAIPQWLVFLCACNAILHASALRTPNDNSHQDVRMGRSRRKDGMRSTQINTLNTDDQNADSKLADTGLSGLENIKQALLEAHRHDQQAIHQHLKYFNDDGFAKKHRKKDEDDQDDDHDDPGPEDTHFCRKRKYRKHTMKSIREAPFIGLFNELGNLSRFEGSSITYAKGAYWVVFDSLRTIAKIDIHFQFRGDGNKLIPEDAGEKESQFEGLQYMPSTDTFLAVRESIDHEEHGLIPLTEEIKINKDEDDWTLASVCPVKWHGLEDENKGWEGLHYYEKDGERFLMGLCESNYCKTVHGDDAPGLERGHGRLILTKYVKAKAQDGKQEEEHCHWEFVKEVHLPEEAYFLDYAGIAFFPVPFGEKVAVVSQEDAAVWVGKFNWDKLEFEQGGKIYFFPRNFQCEKIFCNVEGLTWLDHQRLLFASDAAKAKQPFSCIGHDQSVHIMALP